MGHTIPKGDSSMDMIIFSGQSNMQGQTNDLPNGLFEKPVENAYEYRFLQDELIPLQAPAGEDIDHSGNFLDVEGWKNSRQTLQKAALLAPVLNSGNMVPAFCESYVTQTGRSVAAVHTAKGSTGIDYWLKGNPGYTAMHRKVKAAIAKVRPERVFFVWLQGESDAIAGMSQKEYSQKLSQLNRAIREDLGVERFGIIQVGRFTMKDSDFEIINAQKEICQADPTFLMLTTVTEALVADPNCMNPRARGHFNSHGQTRIGTLAGMTLGAYAGGKGK